MDRWRLRESLPRTGRYGNARVRSFDLRLRGLRFLILRLWRNMSRAFWIFFRVMTRRLICNHLRRIWYGDSLLAIVCFIVAGLPLSTYLTDYFPVSRHLHRIPIRRIGRISIPTCPLRCSRIPQCIRYDHAWSRRTNDARQAEIHSRSRYRMEKMLSGKCTPILTNTFLGFWRVRRV